MSRAVCCESGLHSSVRGYSREGVIYRDPEVYIRAPFRSFFRYFFFLNMLSYHLGIKTLLWDINGNISVLSRDESRLRGPANLKNSRQIIVYMVNLQQVTGGLNFGLQPDSIGTF